MCSGVFSLSEWLGLRLLGLYIYRVTRASWSEVTPDAGVLWLGDQWSVPID